MPQVGPFKKWNKPLNLSTTIMKYSVITHLPHKATETKEMNVFDKIWQINHIYLLNKIKQAY